MTFQGVFDFTYITSFVVHSIAGWAFCFPRKEHTVRVKESLFEVGQVVATHGAIEAMEEANVDPLVYLFRHTTGDFGDLVEEDKKANQDAIEQGGRVFSAYILPTGVKIWLITESDRSSSCYLLPSEY